MKVLLIDDNATIRSTVSSGLRSRNNHVDACPSASAGLRYLQNNIYDVIILDYILPDMTGAEVCNIIRLRKITTPIIMLSHNSDLTSKSRSFTRGADDYLEKPFNFEELCMRLNSLKRRHGPGTDIIHTCNDISINEMSFTATVQEKILCITKREFDLLLHLIKNKNRVISKENIIQSVWEDSISIDSNTVEMHMCSLRKKLKKGKSESVILTKPNIGYIIYDD